MDESRKGTWRHLSPARKMVCEILHHARKVPTLPQSRSCNLAALVAARREAAPAPSWNALLLKAFGLAAQMFPPLRQAHIPFPWPHLYEHPTTEAALMVHREWQGEPVVLGSHIRAPEQQRLTAIDARLRWLQTTPVEDVPHFRKWLRTGRLPGLVRRFLFWHSLHLSGYWRAKRLGTCVVSSVGNLGGEQLHPLTPLTTYFTAGPVAPDGEVTLTLIYDHRVMDARTVALALIEIEKLLNTDLAAEVHSEASARSRGALRIVGAKRAA